MYITYTRKYLLSGANGPPQMQNPYAIPGLSSTSENPPLTEKCLRSLSLCFFGNEHGLWDLTTQGMQLYGVALKELNEALSDPERVQSIEVLESVMLLSLYEVS